MDIREIDKNLYEEVRKKRDEAQRNVKDKQVEVDFFNDLLEELKPKDE